MTDLATASFDGVTYNPALDYRRLRSQLLRVAGCMSDGEWRSLRQISELTGDPEASVSARLRDLRKDKFGAHDVQTQRIGDPRAGHWVYRIPEVGNVGA